MFDKRRIYYKTYWRLPFGLGEVQYGHLTHSVTVWFRGKCYRVIR
jgi:hypothetical protein